jgi:hypothetical protein
MDCRDTDDDDDDDDGDEYFVQSTNYVTPYYATFSSLLSLHPS